LTIWVKSHVTDVSRIFTCFKVYISVHIAVTEAVRELAASVKVDVPFVKVAVSFVSVVVDELRVGVAPVKEDAS